MKNTSVDKLVMLLSTDWFFDYWSAIGLSSKDENRRLLQKKCQDIVQQQIMIDVKEYWLTSFTESRIEKTVAKFLDAVKSCGLGNFFLNRVNALLENRNDLLLDVDTAWLLGSITELIISGTVINDMDEFAPMIKEKIASIWMECDLGGMDFSELCLNSESTWDQYIRGVTPDLPTMVADYVAVEITGKDRFLLFWDRVGKSLPSAQKVNLLNGYKSAAYELSGQKFVPPSWMEI